jgi:hypothetical protein
VTVDIVEVVESQTELLQIIFAARTAGRFPRLLHGGQQQRDQDGDNGDHNQQLDQGKSLPAVVRTVAEMCFHAA